jgi:hypothetical protein
MQVMPLWLLQAFWQQALPISCHKNCGIASLETLLTTRAYFAATSLTEEKFLTSTGTCRTLDGKAFKLWWGTR